MAVDVLIQPQVVLRPHGALPVAWHVRPLVVNLGGDQIVLIGIPSLFGLTLAEAVFTVGDFA